MTSIAAAPESEISLVVKSALEDPTQTVIAQDDDGKVLSAPRSMTDTMMKDLAELPVDLPDDAPVATPGKKNTRFGRNADGTAAKKAERKPIVRKSRWGKYLADFKMSHPELCSLDATIEARKLYRPKNNKQKSFERIFTEAWLQRNPKGAILPKDLRTEKIRSDFIKMF